MLQWKNLQNERWQMKQDRDVLIVLIVLIDSYSTYTKDQIKCTVNIYWSEGELIISINMI